MPSNVRQTSGFAATTLSVFHAGVCVIKLTTVVMDLMKTTTIFVSSVTPFSTKYRCYIVYFDHSVTSLGVTHIATSVIVYSLIKIGLEY